eukprot:COSAG06_NODE_17198_length_955_cov_1.227804_1_plen_107_part_00
MVAPLRAAWRGCAALSCGYATLLARRPYVTSSATGGLVMLSGDALAQYYERRGAAHREREQQQQQQHGHHHASGGYDTIRAAVMVGFSMGAFMPVNTLWYRNAVER